MKLSCRAIYGLRAVVDLAYHGDGEPMQMRDIAERAEIPDHFLQQIFQDLKKAGIVASKRGPGGGYRLVSEPQQLTIAGVFEVLDSLPTVPDIVEDDGKVERVAQIGDRVCHEIVERLGQMLEDVTVAELVERGEKMGLARQGYEGFVYVI